jgi:hypothetical protein
MPEPRGQAPRTDRRIRLLDGCRLGYYEHGPSDSHLLLYFHGTPSSRREVGLFVSEGLTERMNGWIIATARGWGSRTSRPDGPSVTGPPTRPPWQTPFQTARPASTAEKATCRCSPTTRKRSLAL